MSILDWAFWSMVGSIVVIILWLVYVVFFWKPN